MANFIWTKHAEGRILERGITKDMVFDTLYSPTSSYPGKEKSNIYEKKMNGKKISVVVKENEKKEWIILSAWMDPPLPGTKDAKEQKKYRNYQKAKGWKKFFLTMLRQLGI